jgi:hypothetical protein
MTKQEIRSNLDDGDGIKIQRMCQVEGVKTSSRYVNQVLREERNKCVRGKAKVILRIAEIQAKENIRLKELAKNNQ